MAGVAVLAGSSAASHDGPHLSISGGSATEGGSITFTVTLADRDPLDTSTITVEYDTADGTAKEPGDYTSKSGTLSFLPADTSETIEVETAQDSLDEPAETFTVTLSNPSSGAEIATASATGTINDDDSPPTVSIGDAPAVSEGGTASLPVTLSAPSGQAVTVNYATSHGSTTAADFTATAPLSGSVSFDAGQTSKSIALPTVDDALDESNETFTVTLSTPVNATIGDGSGTGTINDNDAAQLSINNAPAVTEGANSNFTVTLSTASSQTVTVNYSTANGSAVAPGDYDAVTNGSVSFAPGETSKPIAISTNEDSVNEAAETFTVTLSSPTNASIASGQGTGTINDNDAAPSLSINDATVSEGNTGTVFAVFTVTLSAASGQQVAVNYATANATATAPADYAAAGGTLTFAAGETTKTISVSVNGDGADEPNETFNLNLGGAVNATISDNQGIATIVDDDGPGISINDVSVGEGSGPAVFTVSLGAPSAQQVTVNYATANGTAVATDDYAAVPATTLTFAPGETTKTVSVTIANDGADELNETFTVNLSGAVNASISDAQGIATIVDDDGPTISINNPAPPAPAAGTESGNVTFTVSLSAASPQAITVQFATAPETATAGSDYATQSGTLTIPAGQASATIPVPILPDNVDEPNETFFVNLANPTNATIADSQGQGTIVDDDSQPTLSIAAAASATEGANVTFTVTLSAASGQPVTVTYSTANGTAVAPGDYAAAPSGTLTFNPGETTKPISISTTDDTLDEANETFTVTLANPTNATIATGQGTGTINDNDNPPTVAVASGPAVVEGNPSVFTVTLSAASGLTVTVNYATSNGSAAAGSDYTASSGVLTFAPGELTKQFSVPTLNDTLDEPASEGFTATLSNPNNATIAAGQGAATGIITDNDEPPAISISDATVATDVPPGRVGEGNSGQGSCAGAPFHQCAAFTVTLSAASGQTVTVNFATADGSATAADYAATSGTLTFAPGETSKTITVSVKGDTNDEFNETFTVNLSGAVNATLADGTGTGTIVDDDGSPALSVTGASDSEGSGDGAIVVVALSTPSALEVRVNFSTSNGSALAGADYTAQSQTLIFAPGQPLSKAISIQLVNDALDEENETFTVQLTNPQNATILNDPNTGRFQGVGTVTIQDNDDPPSVAIGDAVVAEGNAGTTNASFAVTLSGASGKEIRVNYATGNGSAGHPGDYAATSGVLTFAPGETTKTILVPVAGDGTVEADETFFVDLTEPTNVVIADPQAVGTITNDDAQQPDPGTTTSTTTTGPTTSTTTTTTTRTTTTPPDPRLTGMGISGRPVVLLGNLAPIGVTCSKRATRNCSGTVTVQGAARNLSIVHGQPTAKLIRLGRAQFLIRRGTTEKVLVPLNKRALKAVNRAGQLRVTVVVTARDAAGKRAKPLTKQLWLKSAQKPKAKRKPKPPLPSR